MGRGSAPLSTVSETDAALLPGTLSMYFTPSGAIDALFTSPPAPASVSLPCKLMAGRLPKGPAMVQTSEPEACALAMLLQV